MSKKESKQENQPEPEMQSLIPELSKTWKQRFENLRTNLKRLETKVPRDREFDAIMKFIYTVIQIAIEDAPNTGGMVMLQTEYPELPKKIDTPIESILLRHLNVHKPPEANRINDSFHTWSLCRNFPHINSAKSSSGGIT